MRRETNTMPHKAITFLAVVAIAALSLTRVSRGAQDSDTGRTDDRHRPNILFIMTDQQHAGMMSCTGNPHLKTPALDALASAGIRFELAYATNPVCVPSRFSLQTGRMPSAIGMRTNESRLPVPRQLCLESLGPLLRRAGYRCAYGGKDHLPSDLSKYAMKHGYEKLTDDRRDGLAEACADFLKQSHDRPFFLFVSFINPHDVCYMAINDFARHQGRPVVNNEASRICERFLEPARKSSDLESFIQQQCPSLPDNFAIPKNEPEAIDDLGKRSFRRYAREQWSENTWRLHRWLYCRLTESVDTQIGTVLRALREAGLEENTLVIFTSDHGDMDAAHRLEHKGVLYEESVRIPFIMAFKGVIPTGRVDRKHLVSNGLDLLPTLCDYAGVKVPVGLSGRSLRALGEGREADDWREHLIVENRNGRMIRTERLKYCVHANGERREMLIDLNRDPGEMTNLADSAPYRNELNHHRRLLLRWLERHNDTMGLSYVIKPERDAVPASQPSAAPRAVEAIISSQPASRPALLPDKDWRAVHLMAWGTAGGPEGLAPLKRAVSQVLAPLGVNVIVYEVGYNYAYQSHPELRYPKYINRDQARKLSRLCRKHGIALIPQFNCLGHQSWVRKKVLFPLLTQYPELEETPFYADRSRWDRIPRSWCPLHPRVNEIVFPMLDELIDAFEAEAFHVGMDEVMMVTSSKCPRCKGKDPAKVFAKAVNDLHRHLVTDKGLTMLMWGDRLLDDELMDFGNGWEASRNGTAGAIDLIPKDIIVCDWHYALKKDYPSVPYLQQKGFRVLPASWRSVEATEALIEFAHREATDKLLGHLCTTWTLEPGHFARALLGEDDSTDLSEWARGSAAAVRACMARLDKIVGDKQKQAASR